MIRRTIDLHLDSAFRAWQLLVELPANTTSYRNLSILLHLSLFYQAMQECLNLNELMAHHIFDPNEIVLTNITGPNATLLYEWCQEGESTLFYDVFYLAYENSREKYISHCFTAYIHPTLLAVNCVCVLCSIVGLYRLGRRIRSKKRVSERNINQARHSATWLLLLWYAKFALVWLVAFDGSQVIRYHIPWVFEPKLPNASCGIVNFFHNLFRYIPTWLLCLTMFDRLVGEYRSGKCGPVVPKTPSRLLVPRLSVKMIRQNSPRPLMPCGDRTVNPLDSLTLDMRYIITNEYHHASSHHAIAATNRCRHPATRHTNSCPISIITEQRTLALGKANQNANIQVGLGQTGGAFITGGAITCITLLNMHLIWLYVFGNSNCVLQPGNSVFFGIIYPRLLEVIQLVLPQILQLVCLVQIGILAQVRRAVKGHSRTNSHTAGLILVPPTQLVTTLSGLTLVFELPAVIKWIMDQQTQSAFLKTEETSPVINWNLVQWTDTNGTMRLADIQKSSLVEEKMKQMKQELLASVLVRTLENQRFICLLPSLLYFSRIFRHLLGCKIRLLWRKVIRRSHHESGIISCD
ncbi:hypothetical protein CLF_112593 [Clonorchis sinensis]|uniref:Uncharacterized protein n=1 Tax=Clonorchis sinensis TaxID=79923 RepID=H2KVL1_CLOSI|nr:hypothetical protein CLF_112593 [Clonorchis sinensis]